MSLYFKEPAEIVSFVILKCKKSILNDIKF